MGVKLPHLRAPDGPPQPSIVKRATCHPSWGDSTARAADQQTPGGLLLQPTDASPVAQRPMVANANPRKPLPFPRLLKPSCSAQALRPSSSAPSIVTHNQFTRVVKLPNAPTKRTNNSQRNSSVGRSVVRDERSIIPMQSTVVSSVADLLKFTTNATTTSCTLVQGDSAQGGGGQKNLAECGVDSPQEDGHPSRQSLAGFGTSCPDKDIHAIAPSEDEAPANWTAYDGD